MYICIFQIRIKSIFIPSRISSNLYPLGINSSSCLLHVFKYISDILEKLFPR